MKKSFILTIVMLMICMIGIAWGDTANVNGAWKLNELQVEGEKTDPTVLGMTMVLKINEDGTASIITGEDEEAEEHIGVWSIGSLLLEIDGEKREVVVSGEELSIDLGLDGMVAFFAKEEATDSATPEATASVEARKENAADSDNTISEEAFLGKWNLTSMSMDGHTLPVSTLGLSIDLSIEPGSVSMLIDDEGGPVKSTLQDNTLQFNNVYFDHVTLEVTEDGSLSFTRQVENGMMMTMYFTPVE
ncbi:MAG: hypothetical protein IJ153_01985 [Clostridia bacterium]|nr:hypothetical protein [Clostridia bacterium]